MGRKSRQSLQTCEDNDDCASMCCNARHGGKMRGRGGKGGRGGSWGGKGGKGMGGRGGGMGKGGRQL